MEKEAHQTPTLVKPKISINWLFVRNILIFVLLILLIVIGYQIITLKSSLNNEVYNTTTVVNVPISVPVEATLLKESSCTKCTDLKLILEQIKLQFGVNITKLIELTPSQPKAQELIAKYNITRLPVLIFSKQLKEYTEVASKWDSAGSVEKDGSYVFRNVNPPLYDLITKKAIGLVITTYLNDSTCKECYDVRIHKTILTNFGLVLAQEKTVDINSNEGKVLKQKLGIEKIPTVILDEQASVYPLILELWEQVGVERNGYFVFTKVEELGMTYKDIVTNKVITPQRPARLIAEQ